MKIAPSILAADFSKLGEEIKEVEAGGADYIHIDVMDGHFVPNITMGPMVVEAARKMTTLPLDVHLMIDHPDRYISDFVNAGADIITIHAEADQHLHKTLQTIKQHGIKAGVVLNPATPVDAIRFVLEDIDMVLIMTVNPGFGGQSFIGAMLPKIIEVKKLIEKENLAIEIEVDGGIDASTALMCKQAGANVFVAGSAIFGAEDRSQAIQAIRKAVTGD